MTHGSTLKKDNFSICKELKYAGKEAPACSTRRNNIFET